MKLKELILQDTPYIPIYRFTLQKFGTQQAMLLSFLIDADSYASVRLKEDNDYFKCTDSFIKKTNIFKFSYHKEISRRSCK